MIVIISLQSLYQFLKGTKAPSAHFCFCFKMEILIFSVFFKKKKNGRPHVVFFYRFCTSTRKVTQYTQRNSDWTIRTIFDGSMRITDIQHRDVIVFKNLRFHPLKQVQQNGVFKNLLSRERVLKSCVFSDSFYRIAVDGTPNRNIKVCAFSNKNRNMWTGRIVFIVFTLSCSLPDSHHTTNNNRPNPTVGTGERQNDVHWRFAVRPLFFIPWLCDKLVMENYTFLCSI